MTSRGDTVRYGISLESRASAVSLRKLDITNKQSVTSLKILRYGVPFATEFRQFWRSTEVVLYELSQPCFYSKSYNSQVVW
jgi:hypothetical protein